MASLIYSAFSGLLSFYNLPMFAARIVWMLMMEEVNPQIFVQGLSNESSYSWKICGSTDKFCLEIAYERGSKI